MADDILRLLEDRAEARARHDQVKLAAKTLFSKNGYGGAIDRARSAPAGAAEARRALIAEYAAESASPLLICPSSDIRRSSR